MSINLIIYQMDDNKRLAAHIDVTIEAANEEVAVLREELTETTDKMTELLKPESVKMEEIEGNNYSQTL